MKIIAVGLVYNINTVRKVWYESSLLALPSGTGEYGLN